MELSLNVLLEPGKNRFLLSISSIPGVDDVFVFISTFRQAAHFVGPQQRMIHTMKTASRATFLTSFTTAAAYAANAFSQVLIQKRFLFYFFRHRLVFYVGSFSCINYQTAIHLKPQKSIDTIKMSTFEINTWCFVSIQTRTMMLHSKLLLNDLAYDWYRD